MYWIFIKYRVINTALFIGKHLRKKNLTKQTKKEKQSFVNHVKCKPKILTLLQPNLGQHVPTRNK